MSEVPLVLEVVRASSIGGHQPFPQDDRALLPGIKSSFGTDRSK